MPAGKRRRLSGIAFGTILALAFGWYLSFYVDYGAQAWFFQDDFGFLGRFAQSPVWSQIFDFANFGRFVSRNLFWYLGQLAFGRNATLFYYFSLSMIIFNSLLIYYILRKLVRVELAAVGTFVCFAATPVGESYFWLSNSQHWLAHLFTLAFAAVYLGALGLPARDGSSPAPVQAARRLRSVDVALLLALYLLGLSSNIFAGLVLGLPMLMLLCRADCRRDPRQYLLVAAALGPFLFFFLSLRKVAVGSYEMQLSLSSLRSNADFYFGGASVLAILVLCCLYGAYVHFRQGRIVVTWFFLSAIAFYLPFAFLVHQRYNQYIALSSVFFACGILAHIEYYLSSYVKRTALLLVLAVPLTGRSALEYFKREPHGRDQRLLVEQLRSFDRARGRDLPPATYCFATPQMPSAGSTVLPPEWWFVGFGAAFQLFVNPDATYQLGDQPKRCDATFFMKRDRLTRSE